MNYIEIKRKSELAKMLLDASRDILVQMNGDWHDIDKNRMIALHYYSYRIKTAPYTPSGELISLEKFMERIEYFEKRLNEWRDFYFYDDEKIFKNKNEVKIETANYLNEVIRDQNKEIEFLKNRFLELKTSLKEVKQYDQEYVIPFKEWPIIQKDNELSCAICGYQFERGGFGERLK